MTDSRKLETFPVNAERVGVSYVETIQVKEGVECDVYSFNGDTSKDLAVVRVMAGEKTPLQRVLSGVTTTEGFVEGRGTLTVKSEDGVETSFEFDEQNQGEVLVEVGQIMQWTAGPDSGLVFYEVCVPPYEDGRYEDLPEGY